LKWAVRAMLRAAMQLYGTSEGKVRIGKIPSRLGTTPYVTPNSQWFPRLSWRGNGVGQLRTAPTPLTRCCGAPTTCPTARSAACGRSLGVLVAHRVQADRRIGPAQDLRRPQVSTGYGKPDAVLRRASERDQRCRWSPQPVRGSRTAAPRYLSGESISTVTLTSRILASTLPRNPGGTSS
jgi:hypothetical protein